MKTLKKYTLPIEGNIWVQIGAMLIGIAMAFVLSLLIVVAFNAIHD